MWILIFVMAPVGILFCWFGYQIRSKGRIELIHDYHHKRVRDEDVKAYTSLMGLSMYIIGGSLLLVGLLSLFIDAVIIVIAITFAGTFCSLFLMNKAQKRYNGGWFS